jgi:hypothetical protein
MRRKSNQPVARQIKTPAQQNLSVILAHRFYDSSSL